MSTKPKNTTTKTAEQAVSIKAPNIRVLAVEIRGTAPYVQLAFPQKVIEIMRAKMEQGSSAKKGKAREPRDFAEDFKQALHLDVTDGWNGIPAPAFRNAMISACGIVGFKMTLAKKAIFILQDGFSVHEDKPLVKIKGKPEMVVHHVRNATGVADLRVRGKFWPWGAMLNVQYDADLFTATDIVNLIHRVGIQVGVGEGRPDSKSSAGMGWGTFEIVNA